MFLDMFPPDRVQFFVFRDERDAAFDPAFFLAAFPDPGGTAVIVFTDEEAVRVDGADIFSVGLSPDKEAGGPVLLLDGAVGIEQFPVFGCDEGLTHLADDFVFYDEPVLGELFVHSDDLPDTKTAKPALCTLKIPAHI